MLAVPKAEGKSLAYVKAFYRLFTKLTKPDIKLEISRRKPNSRVVYSTGLFGSIMLLLLMMIVGSSRAFLLCSPSMKGFNFNFSWLQISRDLNLILCLIYSLELQSDTAPKMFAIVPQPLHLAWLKCLSQNQLAYCFHCWHKLEDF